MSKTDLTWKEHDHIVAKCPLAPLKLNAWRSPIAVPERMLVPRPAHVAASRPGFYKLETEDDR